jgi:hypothetical protein
MSEAPIRRRYQFGIGTMLLIVTVFAGWFGWEVSFIRARKEMRQEIKAEYAHRGAVLRQLTMWGGLDSWDTIAVNKAVSYPAWRRWLGDTPMDLPTVTRNTEADAIRTRALFPESEIHYYNGCVGLSNQPRRVRIIDEAFGRKAGVQASTR